MTRWLIYAALAGVCALQLLPFVWAALTSLRPLEQAYQFPPQWTLGQPQWHNYTRAAEHLPLVRFMLNSLVISVAAVFGAVLSSSMAGYLLARGVDHHGRPLPLRGLLFAGLVVSMLLPSQVLLIPHFLMFDQLGWIGTYKPLIVPAWLGGGAFNVFLFRQYFSTIPRDVEDAAIVDGATRWQVYRHVLLPMARPAVVAATVLSFLYHWQAFLQPLLYLSDFETFPVSLGLRMYQTLAGTWVNLLMAASLIALLPPLLLFILGQKQLVSGLRPPMFDR